MPISLSVPDAEDGQAQVQITGVSQDEPTSGLTPQDPSPDAMLSGGSGVSLRAERDNKGDGRVYIISYVATDTDGMSCSGTVAVEVRRWKSIAAVDSGSRYDSLT